MTRQRAVGILISGTGSNMAALVASMQQEGSPARPAIVVSNRPDAPGLARAAAAGVPMATVNHRAFGKDRAAFEQAVSTVLDEAGVEVVALAGFMRILTAQMVARWSGRMLNVHPSLLPAFPGLDTHAKALAAGVAIHGCTVHEVVPELDAGPILGQAAVPVVPGDTTETLAARVLRQEHQLYPAVLARFAADPDAARREPLSILDGGA